jgi:hypothetical protein
MKTISKTTVRDREKLIKAMDVVMAFPLFNYGVGVCIGVDESKPGQGIIR